MIRVNARERRIKRDAMFVRLRQIAAGEVFYIIRPDPINVWRLKFGISTSLPKRLSSYHVLCPEAEVVAWRYTAPLTERELITTMTKDIGRKISAEVYDIKEVGQFKYRIIAHGFQRPM